MHKAVRELVDKAATIGWTCDGQLDGKGHYTLVHQNGATFSIAATPSEWRGAKNALANLERIAGRKTNRIVKNRSHKRVDRTDFDPTRAASENRRWADKWGGDIDNLYDRLDQAIARLRELAAVPCRTSATKATSVIAEIRGLEDQLHRFGQTPKPFDITDLGETG